MFSCALIKYLLAPYSGLSLELILSRYILGGCTLGIFVRFLFSYLGLLRLVSLTVLLMVDGTVISMVIF